MGADAAIYCLEQVTDYAQFERLCHDLMPGREGRIGATSRPEWRW
jgi:hypothetical protein